MKLIHIVRLKVVNVHRAGDGKVFYLCGDLDTTQKAQPQ